MMRIAVVTRDLEIGGVAEETENIVEVLDAKYLASGLQGRPGWRLTLLVEVKSGWKMT